MLLNLSDGAEVAPRVALVVELKDRLQSLPKIPIPDRHGCSQPLLKKRLV